jgi:hypothetical protein
MRILFLTLTVAVPLAAADPLRGQAVKRPAKDPISFGALRPANPDEVKSRAEAWLKGSGKFDATRTAFEAVWAQGDRSVVDRLADTFALGDDRAARLLSEARDSDKPAPTDAPALLTGSSDAFFRANLGLAYAKALSNRRVYEEALAILTSIKPEQVVDPSAYLFHRAVAEHALAQKQSASRSINRLLDDGVDVPERYKIVSLLMAFDMQSWREKDLGWIARKMDNIERRLKLARGGPQTQKIQKEVVARLDEIIKQLENQAKNDANGGA